MSWMTKLVGKALGRGDVRPSVGQVIVPRKEDSVREYPSVGVTPSRLAAILREADEGSLSSAMHLYEQMEEKDAHLYSVANTRRLALTGLDWQILSAADVDGDDARISNNSASVIRDTTEERQPQRTQSTQRMQARRVANAQEPDAAVHAVSADHVAQYCREALASLTGFDDVLQHLSLATGRNISIAELVWDLVGGELRLVDLAPVDFTRIVFDEFDRPRILTESEPQSGIEPTFGKFMVHTPHHKSGHAQRGGLLRVTALVYLAKQLALKDWMVFAEVFGMPVRIARYEPTATPEEKNELLRMLETLGSHAAGIFSRAVELQVIEANRGTIGPPYERLIDFLNREMSKAWLGQTLTTETSGAAGTLAASVVQDQVRQDIRADDIRKEAQMVRSQLLAPLVRFRFGPEAPIPHFTRRPGRPKDLTELTGVLDHAINRLGMQVPRQWTHETLGIPMASPTESTLGGAAK